MTIKVLKQLGTFIRVKTLANNQTKIYFENGEVFQSYNSIIYVKVDGNIFLTKDHDYSNTTIKWRNKALGVTNDEFKDRLKSNEYILLD